MDSAQGFVFEDALSKFFQIFFPDKWLDEKRFSEVFSIEDKIVDFAIFTKDEILLIQVKHRYSNSVSQKKKILERLHSVKDELRLHLPHHKIIPLVLVVRKSGKIKDETPEFLSSRKIWISFIRLKNFLLKNSFIYEDFFLKKSEEFKNLILQYQIYERKLIFDEDDKKEKKIFSDIFFEIEKLSAILLSHQRNIEIFVERVEKLR